MGYNTLGDVIMKLFLFLVGLFAIVVYAGAHDHEAQDKALEPPRTLLTQSDTDGPDLSYDLPEVERLEPAKPAKALELPDIPTEDEIEAYAKQKDREENPEAYEEAEANGDYDETRDGMRPSEHLNGTPAAHKTTVDQPSKGKQSKAHESPKRKAKAAPAKACYSTQGGIGNDDGDAWIEPGESGYDAVCVRHSQWKSATGMGPAGSTCQILVGDTSFLRCTDAKGLVTVESS